MTDELTIAKERIAQLEAKVATLEEQIQMLAQTMRSVGRKVGYGRANFAHFDMVIPKTDNNE